MSNPAISTTFFPHTQSSYYWSSTSGWFYPYKALCIGFDKGFMHFAHKMNMSYVRAVRTDKVN
ncbi:MAG: DUF1566 domain-containing protein [Deltaproteobacteria bacterium]|nr:DUF1566 domain-containing protein [Candidatus Tharpella aukensis]